MIQIKEKGNCCGCQACFNACPRGAITMQEDAEGFLYPHVDQSECVNCGLCERVCPEMSPQENADTDTKVFACYRTEYEKRLQSQSGGIFALLAEKVIEEGGVVFGAAFDGSWKLCHKGADDFEDLRSLLGSKYVQSDIGRTFEMTKEKLKSGNTVLFSGTPCQIQGLRKYLGKDYDNLIAVDLICHGVPSPKVWKSYLEEYGGDDKLIDFVQKDKTKHNASVYTFAKRGAAVSGYDENPFTKGFNQNLYLRPSCYQCSFKGIERCSDITLGDFWGLESFHPEFGDAYGISAVITHTEKGLALFRQVMDKTACIECGKDMLIPGNPCLVSSVQPTDKRQAFFEMWEEKGTTATIRELTKPTLSQRIAKKLAPVKWYALAAVNKIRRKKS